MTRTPPHSLNDEAAVLGAMMLDRESVDVALDWLSPDDFYLDAHRMVFEAVGRLVQRDAPARVEVVADELKAAGSLEAVGGMRYLTDLHASAALPSHVEYHARAVLGFSARRNMIAAAVTAQARCYDLTDEAGRVIDQCEEDVLAVGQRGAARATDFTALVDAALDRVQKGCYGLDWELRTLNYFAGPMSDTYPTLIGALGGTGKTTMAIQETIGKCRKGVGVLGFSLEQSEADVVDRMASLLMGISVNALRAGARNKATKWVKDGTLARTYGEVRAWPLVIVGQPDLTVAQMAARARRVKREFAKRGTPLGLMWVDYAGKINAAGRDEYQKAKAASEAVRRMVKALTVPTIVLTQVTEQGGSNGAGFPRVHSRDSKDWYNDAGTVIWLHRPAKGDKVGSLEQVRDKDKALAWVEKSRMGGQEGVVDIGWVEGPGGFADLDPLPAYLKPPPEQTCWPSHLSASGEVIPGVFGDPFAETED